MQSELAEKDVNWGSKETKPNFVVFPLNFKSFGFYVKENHSETTLTRKSLQGINYKSIDMENGKIVCKAKDTSWNWKNRVEKNQSSKSFKVVRNGQFEWNEVWEGVYQKISLSQSSTG